jgi:hypothetical protein
MDFLKEWLQDGKFSTEIEDYLAITDNEVIVELRKAAIDNKHPGHIHAKRIIEHKHFKVMYECTPGDRDINIKAGEFVYMAACEKFGTEYVRYDRYPQKGGIYFFPVLHRGKILPSTKLSDTLAKSPVTATDFVFIDRTYLTDAEKWLAAEHDNIINKLEPQE